jgi:hypothetical protein
LSTTLVRASRTRSFWRRRRRIRLRLLCTDTYPVLVGLFRSKRQRTQLGTFGDRQGVSITLQSSKPNASEWAQGVRRAKAALSSGCKSHPAIAPAGSNRSSCGVNHRATFRLYQRLSTTAKSQPFLGLLDLPKPEVCGLATPASLIAHRRPRPHQTAPNTRIARCQSSERAVFHRSDGNIITRLA